MINKLLFSLIFCIMLALPAFAGSKPVNDPSPGKNGTDSLKALEQKVIIIKTALKDSKEGKVTVEKNGEILVPKSTGVSVPSYYGGANLPQPGAEGVALIKPGDGGGETKSGEGGELKSEEGEEAKRTGEGGEATSGASGIGEARDASASNLSGNSDNMAGGGGGLAAGGVPDMFAAGDLGGNLETAVTIPVDNSAAVIPAAKLQALIDQSVSDDGVPGIVLAVQTQAGTWIGAAGKGDLGDAALNREPQAMTADMQVRLAGVTKLFTAAFIMKLAEDNKINLDDPVDNVLWPGAVPSGAHGELITARMLLNHTSGLHDHETTQEFFDGLISYPTLPWDPIYDILPLIEAYPLDFDPGKDFKYNNSGYCLLGTLAEAGTGFSGTVANMIKTEMFDPLNLSQTTLNPSGLFDLTNPFARNYCFAGVPQFPGVTDTTDWDLSFDWTSGSGVSTGQDMLTFTQALFGGQVVNRQSLQEMTTPQPLTSAQGALTFGYGLEVVNQDPWYGEKMYKSDGETPGAFARWLYFPDSRRTIFIALNRCDKRFNTEPPLAPPPAASQVDASAKADEILAGVKTILVQAQAN